MSSQTIDLNEIDAAVRAASNKSFLAFARCLIIPSASGPKLFNQVMEDFQRDFFEDIAPSLHAVRNGTKPPARRFWLERTKKTAKDSDVAVCLLWLAAFTERPLLGQVCAANSEQAGIIEDRARAILHYNPWLNGLVEIVQRIIRSKKNPEVTKVQIEATGSAGAAQGPTPDVLVLNELVHVDRWDVMKAHMNNAAGVPMGIVIIATNAGVRGTPAEVWRKNALEQRNKSWRVHIYTKRSPWVSQQDVDDAKRLDPIGAEYARLWEGRWVSGVGGAVSDDEIDRCFMLDGPSDEALPGWRYVGGLDLGVSHDHAGVVVLGIDYRNMRIKLVWMKGLVPSVPNDKGVLEVDCDAVEKDCYDAGRRFRIEWFGYDPAAGGSFMAQRLRKRGLMMKEMTFASSANQTKMAVAFVTALKDGKLECFDDDEGRLRRDFGKFSIEHKPPSRYKLTAVSDEHGHADVGVALVIPLPRAIEILERASAWEGTAVDDSEITEDDMESMPDELREIYDMDKVHPREYI